MVKRQKILITGRVQGVGFRPAVYRLACELRLTGFVFNDTLGVIIELQGAQADIVEFIKRIHGKDGPVMAEIHSCNMLEMEAVAGEQQFTIKTSQAEGSALSQVTADIASCGDCLAEMADENDFRYRYPFINCTNCGPRYSIVKTIPYDRPNTTMSAFAMCEECAGQYGDVPDRRFHAQPVACARCGPRIRMTDNMGNTVHTDTDEVISEAAKALKAGKIVGIKGIGGFHLAADALNEEAVRELRRRKRRDHKPFAMMAGTVEAIEKYAYVNDSARRLLESPEAPIVLLAKKDGCAIAASVAEGISSLGFMLCYAPLHHLLFAAGLDVLVMTSGNISDEPLICKNDKAIERLGGIVDAFVMHDREIYRQVDDSIVHFIDEKPAMLRRARGYVPTPVLMSLAAQKDILAAGADLKNTFCFVKRNQLICSEHTGDLADAEVYHHYVESIEHLRRLFEVKPKVIACDLHPAYLSSQYAHSIPDVKVITVQHHWAHIASVMAEYDIEGPVIGLACDGTGYGTDGAIWGCECMAVSLADFERLAHLEYYDLAGADAAGKEAIRPVLGLLRHAYGDELDMGNMQSVLEGIEPDREKQDVILEQTAKRLNTVRTSSLGRVFDAVAALLGLGGYNHFDAQLPMALEAIAEPGIEECYSFEFTCNQAEPDKLNIRETIRQLIEDIGKGTSAAEVSSKFHNTLAAGLLQMAKSAANRTQLNTVALSGGVFCNRYLTNRLYAILKKDGFTVLCNRKFPANDGGISVGQAAIAARMTSSCA